MGLVGVQTFVENSSAGAMVEVVFDARFVALALAVLLLIIRAPFIVVVFAAALAAALIRLWF
jgi:hypothetical protein